MNTKITYTRRVTIKDKPLYRTIAEWTLIGGLLGGLVVAGYYKQQEFRENIENHSQQENTNDASNVTSSGKSQRTADTYTNETSNISGNKLERVLE